MNDKPNPNAAHWILASASPRRRELLAALEKPFTVISPSIDETAWPGEMPASFAQRMAYEKALAVVSVPPAARPCLVIAADTIVVLGNRILGKPVDDADAAAMLHALSGNIHHVITGLCVWRRLAAKRERITGEAVSTKVAFRGLTEAEIHHYVASGEPMDKAGAYAIQGGAAGMVDHIDGSYSNVVGLPMETLMRLLE
jgi:septum formation protein